MISEQRELQYLIKRIEERFKQHEGHITDLRRFQMAVLQGEQIENALRLMDRVQHHAVSYSNVIIAAGYAAFFALWSTLRDDLPSWLHSLSGLLIVISLVLFVVWEIHQMIARSIEINRLYRILDGTGRTPDIIEQWQDAMDIQNRNTMRWWPAFLVPSMLCGLLAAACLLGFFAVQLWRAAVN